MGHVNPGQTLNTVNGNLFFIQTVIQARDPGHLHRAYTNVT